MQMDERWKMIYLARRNPALAPEDFPQAWREHSALGRQCRNVQDKVLGVRQCARVLDRGTVTRPAEVIADDLDGRGASLSVVTGRHQMAISATCLSDDFGPVLALAAGWWGLRSVLRTPVVETLRKAAT